MNVAHIVHSLPGRMRVRIPALRNDAVFFDRLSNALGEMDGMEFVRTNSATGSVVMRFHAETGAVLARLHQLGLEAEERDMRNAHAARSRGGHGGEPIRLVSGRDIDPMFMAGAALALVGAVQVWRGRIVVPAITAFWYASEAFRASGKRA